MKKPTHREKEGGCVQSLTLFFWFFSLVFFSFSFSHFFHPSFTYTTQYIIKYFLLRTLDHFIFHRHTTRKTYLINNKEQNNPKGAFRDCSFSAFSFSFLSFLACFFQTDGLFFFLIGVGVIQQQQQKKNKADVNTKLSGRTETAPEQPPGVGLAVDGPTTRGKTERGRGFLRVHKARVAAEGP